jgi:endonuclease-3 related protein
MDMHSISDTPLRRLEAIVRPSGYYRQKAKRLHDICSLIRREYGGLDRLFMLDLGELREVLLSMNGIGEETADSIVLYAAGKPTFVVDAYTRRAMHRIDPSISDDISYGDLKRLFESGIKQDLELYKDFHAQFVELGKSLCKKRNPLCAECPLNTICKTGIRRAGLAPATKSCRY